ncbi:hypothetical protein AAE478_005326 [Parahypoxylon ruwenzoriense]
MSDNQTPLREQLKLPVLPEKITVSWLSHALSQKVRTFELTKSILNACASKLFITLTYDDNNVGTAESTGSESKLRPTNVCIKGGFYPTFMEIYPDILLRLYKNEADFFDRVAPNLSHIDLPRSYYAAKDTNQGLVIMDDLEALGAEFGEPVNAWPVERVLAGVEQLAALHAGTWGAKNSDYPWVDPEFYDQMLWAMFSRWDDLIHRVNRPPLQDILKDKRRVRAAFKKYFASKNPRFWCLVHGDAHIGNTYLMQGAPRFLDWQFIHVGSAFHDVAYFISGSLAVEDRRAHEMRILDHYLAALSRFGGPSLSVQDEEVIIEYRKSMLAGYNWILTAPELHNEERFRSMYERHGTALVDHKTIELVESLPDTE